MDDSSQDHGFTLIEAMVVVALFGILAAIAISGWSAWAKASAHSGTAREVQAVLQQAHQRAVAEGQAVCVWFDVAANSYSMRRACDPSSAVISGPFQTESPLVRLEAPDFGGSAGVTMHPRGTAVAGSVLVSRSDSAKKYSLTVERLTGRVTLS